MLYKVIAYFGPNHPFWEEFTKEHWIQPLTSFDSIDGILCPDLFVPQTDEDWQQCINEDFRTSFIKDERYALQIASKVPNAKVVGLIENTNCDRSGYLLGYDLLDEHHGVSLITNWGPHDRHHPLCRFPAVSNGLFPDYDVASDARQYLRNHFANSEHPAGSVWAVFSVNR